MSSDSTTTTSLAGGLAAGTWWLDPERSSVEFRTRTLWGLIPVRGGFGHFRGSLDLAASPAIELVIKAASVDTGNKRRDEHLRSADFFDVDEHPEVRFEAGAASLDGDALHAAGVLRAAGGQAPLDVTATVRPVGAEFEIEASARIDQRELGMNWDPLRMGRPTALFVRGRLTRG